MNSKQRRTLTAIFAEPTAAGVAWQDVESLFLSIGCIIVEGTGSRVRFRHGDAIATFHRPHPGKEAKRYQLRDARAFLDLLGIKP